MTFRACVLLVLRPPESGQRNRRHACRARQWGFYKAAGGSGAGEALMSMPQVLTVPPVTCAHHLIPRGPQAEVFIP